MDILEMNKEMYSDIAELDNICFQRDGALRSFHNMDLLSESFPKGCLVITIEGMIIGYTFSKKLGNVGYMGPLGVHPNYQGKGYAKRMISAGIDILKKEGCVTIGLETMPESGNHIGLYQSLGFRLTFPTLMYHCPDDIIVDPYDGIVKGKDIHSNLIEEFNRKVSEEYEGFNIMPDLEAALRECEDNVFFYCIEGKPVGVLFYCSELYRFVYGVFLKRKDNLEQFLQLYAKLKKQLPEEKLAVRVNTKYVKAMELHKYGFKVGRSLARLTYEGYHGRYEEKERDGLIIKAWVG